MLDTTKINYSLKKLVGKQHTWNNKKWFEEEDGIILYQHAREVWINTISSTPPSISDKIIKIHKKITMVEDVTVQGRRSFYTTNKLRGFIPPSYGINYSVNVYIAGVKIPTSHSSEWIFDYANGILSFENTPPVGNVEIDVFQYVGRTFAQYLDSENNSISRGILGLDTPTTEYVIQHNMNSFDVDAIIYVFDDVDGVSYWKKDVIPLILLDENRVKIQLSEEHPIRFIIKSYENPNI